MKRVKLFFLLAHLCWSLFALPFTTLHDSYLLAESLGKYADIDDSHNHIHSKEVLFWACEILENEKLQLSSDEILFIGRCALLHDLMDHKYTDFSDVVHRHLRQYHTQSDTERMMKVMSEMSYSKIVDKNGIVTMPLNADHVFHVVREADLLSSYNIARMIEFRLRNQTMTRSEIIRDVLSLYHERMAKLIERRLFVFPSSEKIATSLDMICKLRLPLLYDMDIYRHLDILRFVHYLSIQDLLVRLQNIAYRLP